MRSMTEGALRQIPAWAVKAPSVARAARHLPLRGRMIRGDAFEIGMTPPHKGEAENGSLHLSVGIVRRLRR